MSQAQLPLFPPGTTEINSNLAFERSEDLVVYFYGHLPVFQHPVSDTKTFFMIASQFYVNGNATQAEISRAFGVTLISLKRAVKRYKEKGEAGFYETPARRGAGVLTQPVLEQVQQLLDEGVGVPEIAKTQSLKAGTLHKAVAAGKLHLPLKKKRLTAPQTR